MKPVLPAVLAVCLLTAACGNDDKPDRPAARPDPVKEAERAVVHVRADYGTRAVDGTGVVYDAGRGLILTSDHAVEAAPDIVVITDDGMKLPARILARAQCHDVAVLKLNRPPAEMRAVRLGNSDDVRNGESVSALSYALPNGAGKRLTRTRGSVAALDITTKLHPLLPPIGPLIAHQTPLNAAGSGSPLLDAEGRMVGLNTMPSQQRGRDAMPGVSFALTSNYLRTAMNALKPGTTSAFVGWKAEHHCHHMMARIAGVSSGHTVPRPDSAAAPKVEPKEDPKPKDPSSDEGDMDMDMG